MSTTTIETRPKRSTYVAVFEQEEDNGYSVSVPALPGCVSQGDTFEEARANIEEAIRLYVEDDRISSPIREIVATIELGE